MFEVSRLFDGDVTTQDVIANFDTFIVAVLGAQILSMFTSRFMLRLVGGRQTESD